MAAYLVVDVDDLLRRFQARNVNVDLQEMAVGLRGGAALAAGLVNADKLKAIAVANWQQHSEEWSIDPQYIFRAAGYEVFDVPQRENIADILIIHYFSYDPEPVDELILATTSQDLLPLIRRIKVTRNARIRMWGSEDVLKGTEFADDIIFQPLETLLGVQTKNVACYVDFENIAISLSEQGFVVNLNLLIERFVTQARAYGTIIKMAAYAPWGQRGTLPPLVDSSGREIADEAPTRLMMANIDPVFNLPGKNSADIRIARDLITASSQSDAADVYILASGDRDFNDVITTLVQRNKTVIVWGVRGSTSRQLEQNPSITVEYIEDFTPLQTHQSLSTSSLSETPADDFVPSQWSSVVIQFDKLATQLGSEIVTMRQLIKQLEDVGVVVSRDRGEDLVSQGMSLGILQVSSKDDALEINPAHPVVEKTRIIRDCVVRRVANTLAVRGWAYVNYGFLLKGLEMERELARPGMNVDDQWRSHWIDALVREDVLHRELIPHRHNPDDLVPVIRLPDGQSPEEIVDEIAHESQPGDIADTVDEWKNVSLKELQETDITTALMSVRIIISVEQFTSFRNFDWCPLGSLHRRLRPYDSTMNFQHAVEYLVAHDVAIVSEYENPQSDFRTKGISINIKHPYAREILKQRDEFIHILLHLYEQNLLITPQHIQLETPEQTWDMDLWLSIMVTENVLNELPGRPGQYSLFRTHHTVKLVAGDAM